ncbi:hypothetical protein J2S55_008329 [Streptosporangium brasiliense]|uniref:Uncharacterized protein n=1 Tax=Streptosporangium brasiliense TaxID=47480 RepID=A0ABT9RJ12_9ACTN|nr:hypothetical protein [Streptosporangium brasiliense]
MFTPKISSDRPALSHSIRGPHRHHGPKVPPITSTASGQLPTRQGDVKIG